MLHTGRPPNNYCWIKKKIGSCFPCWIINNLLKILLSQLTTVRSCLLVSSFQAYVRYIMVPLEFWVLVDSDPAPTCGVNSPGWGFCENYWSCWYAAALLSDRPQLQGLQGADTSNQIEKWKRLLTGISVEEQKYWSQRVE